MSKLETFSEAAWDETYFDLCCSSPHPSGKLLQYFWTLHANFRIHFKIFPQPSGGDWGKQRASSGWGEQLDGGDSEQSSQS